MTTMAVKRMGTRPRAGNRAITFDQIGELMEGRGQDMGELITGKPSFDSEEQRRDLWSRFKARVYQDMRECQSKLRHPAAFYEYDDFTREDFDHDREYFHPDVGRAIAVAALTR